MAIIVPDYFGEAFSRSYLQAQHYAQQEAERKRREEDLRKSLEVMAGTNAPLPEDTTMRPTVVQTPTAPLAGQSTLTTQFSAPVSEVAPAQTQTTTADLPQKDPYKEGLKNIELAYREKIKNVTQMKNPTLALNFLQQSMQERDIAKAEHNSAAFQSTLNEIMNNPNLTPAQRIGMAVKANSTFKAGFKVNEIVKMFETEKPNLQIAPNGMVVDMRTGLPVQGTPTYAKPREPKQPTAPTTKEVNGIIYQWNPSTGTWDKSSLPTKDEGGFNKDELNAVNKIKDKINEIKSMYWIKDPVMGTATWSKDTPPEIIQQHKDLQSQQENIMKGAEGRRLTNLAVNDLTQLKSKGVSYEQALDSVVQQQEAMKAKGVDPTVIIRKLNEIYGKKWSESQ